MEAGITVVLFTIAALIATFVRKSMDEEKGEVGFKKYRIQKGKLISRKGISFIDNQLSFIVMFGRNSLKVRKNRMNVLYGQSFGFGNYNSICICWKVTESNTISLYLRTVVNGTISYYSLCQVSDYEEVEIRVSETGKHQIAAEVLKRTILLVHRYARRPFESQLKFQIYPQLRRTEDFDVEVLIKEN